MSKNTAVAPLTEALPELSAAQYSKVREWDADRMQLQEGFETADGEYLIKIRDELKPKKLWEKYLAARGVPTSTASVRIRKAEGRYVRSKGTTVVPVPVPAPLAAPVRAARGSAFDPMDPIDEEEDEYAQTTWSASDLLTVDKPHDAALRRMEQFIKAATLVATMHTSSEDAATWAEEFPHTKTESAESLLDAAAVKCARLVQAVRETHMADSKIRRIK